MNLNDTEIKKWLDAMEFDNVSSIGYVEENIIKIIRTLQDGKSLKLIDQKKEIKTISEFTKWLNKYNSFDYFRVSELEKRT